MIAQPKIGAYVLETLTTGMYTDALDSVREYIQNSGDAIRKAEKAGIIAPGEGRVDLYLDEETRTLRIRDNGVGISTELFLSSMLNIGMSEKRIDEDAGFRGIGRLAGMAYCGRLYFRSKAQGEKKVSVVSFECKTLREECQPKSQRTNELAHVLGNQCKASTEEAPSGEHFFEVVLEDLSEAAADFLLPKALEKYLGDVAPVDFDPMRFIYAKQIVDWAEKYDFSMPRIKVFIHSQNNCREVFKHFRSKYNTRQANKQVHDVHIKGICFHPSEVNGGPKYWIWYSKSDLLGMIDDDSAGLRIRKNNIALGGPEQVAALFAKIAKSNSRFNGYFIGEIHILSNDVVPNARRDALESNPEWRAIEEDLMKFVKARCDDVRQTSDARNKPTAKVVASAQTVTTDVQEHVEVGVASPTEKATLQQKVKTEIEKIEKLDVDSRQDEERSKLETAKKALEDVLEQLQSPDSYAIGKVSTSLDRKQKSILRDVLEIIRQTLSTESCSNNDNCYKRLKSAIVEGLNTRSLHKKSDE